MLRNFAILALATIAIYGCASSPDQSALAEPTKSVDEPRLTRSPALFLLPPGRDTNKLRIGDDLADVTSRSFPMPPDAFPFRELPAGFKAPYSASGYRSPGVSFGAIYYKSPGADASQVAQAMTDEEGVSEEEVEASVASYQDAFGRPPDTLLPGTKVRYWFWEDEDAKQRFMVCAIVSRDKKDAGLYQLIDSLGDDVVMDALRMSVKDGLQDRKILDPNPPPIQIAPPPDKATHRVRAVPIQAPPSLKPSSASVLPGTVEAPQPAAAKTAPTGAPEASPNATQPQAPTATSSQPTTGSSAPSTNPGPISPNSSN